MKRHAFTAAVGATLVATILASCSSDTSKPLEPVDQPKHRQSDTGRIGHEWWRLVAARLEAASQSSNKVTVCHSGNGKNYTQITVSVQGAAAIWVNRKMERVVTRTTTASARIRRVPPPATPSNLQVCKVAGTRA